jgi:hypothetical protein
VSSMIPSSETNVDSMSLRMVCSLSVCRRRPAAWLLVKSLPGASYGFLQVALRGLRPVP